MRPPGPATSRDPAPRGRSSRGPASRGRPASRPRPVVAVLLDVACVLAFVAIGRASHHDGESVAGLATVLWPFLAGLALGLLATRAWRRPAAIVPAGLGAWLGAAAGGMLLRVAAGQGTAPAFIGVALAFLGLFLLGWRAVAAALVRS
jgi:peptidoglycan/LPS O-acetylase OafA/YrhL